MFAYIREESYAREFQPSVTISFMKFSVTFFTMAFT